MYRSVFLTRDRISGSNAVSVCRVRTASSRNDFRSAFGLIQRRYQASGLLTDTGTSMRIMPYHLSAASQVFVAERNHEVVGTITLVRDGDDGLPMDTLYPEAIGNARKTSDKIGEITSLAVDPLQASPGKIFMKLTRLLTFFARAQGLEYLTAVVHPRHAKFYRHAVDCQVIGDEKSVESVGGSPGIPLLFGNINDSTHSRSRLRNKYFEGDFSGSELKPSPMLGQDCEYFYSLLNQ